MKSATNLKILKLEVTPEKFSGNLCDFFDEIVENYLDYDILETDLPMLGKVYYPLNAELIGEIMGKHSAKMIKIPHGNKILDRFIGDSVFVSNGPTHKNQRRWMNPIFTKKQTATLTQGIVDCTKDFISKWKDQEEIQWMDRSMELVIRIIATNLFGNQLSGNEAELVSVTLNRLLVIFSSPVPLTTEEEAEVMGLISSFDVIVMEGISRRRNNPKQYDDLLQMLVTAQESSEYAVGTDEEIRNNVGTLFLAGYEATATALVWTFYLLSQFPEYESQCLSEVDEVLNGRKAEVQDLQQLMAVNQMILESMRLYPPSYQIGRMVTEDFSIQGLDIMKQNIILLSQYVMHRHPHYFTEPLMVSPERFSHELLSEIDRFAYFPFGLGSRICIGKDFSLNMLTLIMATIMQEYRLEYVGENPILPLTGTTLVPNKEMIMKLHKREAGSCSP